ncbi:polysaccharide deacetylase family protein [Geomonas sp. RF6]|uniref:polysaccharide deacetylase family protein n=1 Tax=Geomonas sp. RF6 TaxID=2897342 RepID=UPI001E5DA487|nr:polysaccharide deacetylase family protein [Geomonas sp. RF6]UFS69108.1 polysaccharide deacetylase family protein [Geomonas sp. RF6]
MVAVPVLMYHALEAPGHASGIDDPGEGVYLLQAEEFRAQMDFLKREGYHTLLLDEVLSENLPFGKAVVLTFDDGHDSNYHLALPILQEYGFRAEFFITTDWIGTPHYLTMAQVRALGRGGMGIGSHAASHRLLSDLPAVEQERELGHSKRVLEEILDREILFFSAPGGRFDAGSAARAEKAGYRGFCTSRPFLWHRRGEGTIPRFAVRGGDTALVKDVVRQRGRTLLEVGVTYQLLNGVKRLMGNGLYNRLRSMALAVRPTLATGEAQSNPEGTGAE